MMMVVADAEEEEGFKGSPIAVHAHDALNLCTTTIDTKQKTHTYTLLSLHL
jgi:hypothetical protein